jgi:hypothetical protein
MKKVILALLVVVSLAWWGYMEYNHGFTVANIHLDNWPLIKTQSFHSDEQIQAAQEIVKQPFTYLGKGRQCFAFVSADGKYILKFLKCHRINRSPFLDSIPLPHALDKLRKTTIVEKERRLAELFTSIGLAGNELKTQTGTLFAHVQPQIELQRKVTLIDRIGISHEIDIDSVPFVLQRKAEKVMPILEAHLKSGNTDELNKRLNQLIAVITERARSGIADPDGRLLQNNNIGFLPDRAIYIDVGTFYRSYKSTSKAYLAANFRQLKPIVALLKKYDPKLAEDFANRMQQAVQKNCEKMGLKPIVATCAEDPLY